MQYPSGRSTIHPPHIGKEPFKVESPHKSNSHTQLLIPPKRALTDLLPFTSHTLCLLADGTYSVIHESIHMLSHNQHCTLFLQSPFQNDHDKTQETTPQKPRRIIHPLPLVHPSSQNAHTPVSATGGAKSFSCCTMRGDWNRTGLTL